MASALNSALDAREAGRPAAAVALLHSSWHACAASAALALPARADPAAVARDLGKRASLLARLLPSSAWLRRSLMLGGAARALNQLLAAPSQVRCARSCGALWLQGSALTSVRLQVVEEVAVQVLRVQADCIVRTCAYVHSPLQLTAAEPLAVSDDAAPCTPSSSGNESGGDTASGGDESTEPRLDTDARAWTSPRACVARAAASLLQLAQMLHARSALASVAACLPAVLDARAAAALAGCVTAATQLGEAAAICAALEAAEERGRGSNSAAADADALCLVAALPRVPWTPALACSAAGGACTPWGVAVLPPRACSDRSASSSERDSCSCRAGGRTLAATLLAAAGQPAQRRAAVKALCAASACEARSEWPAHAHNLRTAAMALADEDASGCDAVLACELCAAAGEMRRAAALHHGACPRAVLQSALRDAEAALQLSAALVEAPAGGSEDVSTSRGVNASSAGRAGALLSMAGEGRWHLVSLHLRSLVAAADAASRLGIGTPCLSIASRMLSACCSLSRPTGSGTSLTPSCSCRSHCSGAPCHRAAHLRVAQPAACQPRCQSSPRSCWRRPCWRFRSRGVACRH